MDREAAVLASARYLRNVRPLDPAELCEYVEADIDAADVRDILRTHAIELAMYERKDGLFEPVPVAPDPPVFDGVDAFPDDLADVVRSQLRIAFGRDWFEGASGDGIREAIRAFKAAYFRGEGVAYDRLTALGYAIYHLPGTYAKTQYVLDICGRANLLPAPLRVLEIGPGVGGAAMGLADYLGDDWPVAYRGIEPSAAAVEVCEDMFDRRDRNFDWTLETERVEAAALEGPYDLILLANVVNELDRPVETIARLRDVLAEDGSIVAFEPADERTSRTLRRVERGLYERGNELDVYAPTLRLWPDSYPTDDCWSFEVEDPIAVPDFQRRLDEGKRASPDERDPATGEFVNVELRYAYSILRTDGQRRSTVQATRARFAPLAESADNVGERINLAVVKLSHSLADADAHPLYVIGDGSQREEHFAVHTRSTGLNRTLEEAPYGAVLSVEAGLVLWNAEESAYNVVVDEDTIVDRIG